jgi:mannosyltransferase OCH1-like enzyme
VWTEKSIRLLILKNYPWFLATWTDLSFMMQKIDAAKICILHTFGGLYADMDTYPLSSIEELLRAPLILSQCYVSSVGVTSAAVFGLRCFSQTLINNGIMACSPRHPVMARCLLRQSITAKPKRRPHEIYAVFIAKTCGPEPLSYALLQQRALQPDLKYISYPPEVLEAKCQRRNRAFTGQHTRVIHQSKRTWVNESRVARLQVLFDQFNTAFQLSRCRSDSSSQSSLCSAV